MYDSIAVTKDKTLSTKPKKECVMKKSNHRIVFEQDITVIGSATSIDESPIPSKIGDHIVSTFGGYFINRQFNYKRGDIIAPNHWHVLGESVYFWTGTFFFVVPLASVTIRNMETGKIVRILARIRAGLEAEYSAPDYSSFVFAVPKPDRLLLTA